MRRFFLPPVFLLLAGCATTPWTNSSDLLQGYKAFSPPRADVPIGAIWVDGQDYTGSGIPRDTVERRVAADILADSHSRTVIEGELAAVLGLAAGAGANSLVRLKSVEIESVPDITNLRFDKADAFLVSAVKVKDFSVKADSAAAAGLSGTVATQAGLAGATVVATDGGTMDVSGSNLYVAYKLARVSRPEISSKSFDFGFRSNEVKVDGFRLEAHLEDNYPCAEKPHFHWEVSNPKVLADGLGLSKHDRGKARFKEDSLPRWVTYSERVPVYKALAGKTITEVQAEFVFAGREEVYLDGQCRIAPKHASATLYVAQYDLLSE